MNQEKLIRFLSLWIVNSVIFNLASLIFKNNVVLGTDKVSKSMAAVIAGLLVTGLSYAVPKIVAKLDFKLKNEYTWQAIFFAANVVLIWTIKRLALVSGLGISNNLYLLIVALVITIVQWQVLRALKFLVPKK